MIEIQFSHHYINRHGDRNIVEKHAPGHVDEDVEKDAERGRERKSDRDRTIIMTNNTVVLSRLAACHRWRTTSVIIYKFPFTRNRPSRNDQHNVQCKHTYLPYTVNSIATHRDPKLDRNMLSLLIEIVYRYW